MDTLGDRIKKLRREKSITQEELGKYFNLVKSTISQYENNVNVPDVEMLKKLADFFGVSVDYLLVRTENETDVETKAYHSLDASGLGEEDIKKVEEYIDLLKQRYNPDGTLKKK